MAKPFSKRVGDRGKVIVAVIIGLIGIMLLLGYYLDATKTWRPPVGKDPRMRTPPRGSADR